MLRWQTAGESHGESLVAMIEGLPAGMVAKEFAILSGMAVFLLAVSIKNFKLRLR